MSESRLYKVNLTGIDTDEYLEAPIVTEGSAWKVVGSASVMSGKRWISVEYQGQVPAYAHSIGTTTMKGYNPALGRTVESLLGLSVIPVLEPSDGADDVGIVKDDIITRARMRLRRRASVRR